MKKLVVAALLVVGMTTFAQEKLDSQVQRLSPEQRVEHQVKKLAKELNLSDKQIQDVRAVALKEIEIREARKAEMEARKESQTRLTPEEMKARKVKFQDEKALLEASMKSILSPDQYTKWLAIRDAKKEKVVERMQNRREDQIEGVKEAPIEAKPMN